MQATEHLCSGIICSIAAIAASKGWPHADRDDDLNAVVALATGTLPQEAGQIYELLSTASGQVGRRIHCLVGGDAQVAPAAAAALVCYFVFHLGLLLPFLVPLRVRLVASPGISSISRSALCE